MITILVAHLIISSTCCWAGYLLYRYILKTDDLKPLLFYAITGLVVLSLLVQVAALWVPAGSYFALAILGVLLVSAFLNRIQFKNFFNYCIKEVRTLPLYTKILLLILWLMIVLINAGPVLMDDTESYHIQMVKWLREYGTVPGLANLHERYGFNSSWFSGIALFGFFPGNSFTILNGALSLWFCYYILSIVTRSQQNYAIVISLLFTLAFSLLLWPMTRGNAASANYDFVTTVVIFILFTETFLTRKTTTGFAFGAEWLIWPVYLCTVRIINFPFLLLGLTAIYYLVKNGSLKRYWPALVICLMLVIPFLARNYILSGYIFYPAPFIDLDADWKADPVMIERLLEYIKYYNRVSTTYLEIAQTKALGSGWVPTWFEYLFLHDKLLLIIGLAGIVLELRSIVLNERVFSRTYLGFFTVMLVYLISWFIVAPDPRFAYGCLLAGTCLFAFHLLSFFTVLFLKRIAPLIVLALIVGSIFYTGNKLVREPYYRNWILPAPLPQPPVKEIAVDNIMLQVPEKINNNWNARCYGTLLPCLYEINPRLQPRGKTIKEGFRLKK